MKQNTIKQFFMLFSLAIFSLASIAVNAQNGPNPPENQSNQETTVGKRNNAALQAINKLTIAEQVAVISLISDVSFVASTDDGSGVLSEAEKARLAEVIAEMKKTMTIHPKWMASDGTTFTSRGEYMEYQWGVSYPSDINPHDPFE